MFEKILIDHCSPTLAGIKTANLVNISLNSREELLSELREINSRLSGKGVRAFPLKMGERSMMLYLYRPGRLQMDLKDPDAMNLLASLGYSPEQTGRCLAMLSKKIMDGSDFPHEIGLFLGYPPSDVRAFMENKGSGYKYVGLWKVYGNLGSALSYFNKCKQCSRIYRDQWSRGHSIEQLTVAT